MTDYFEERNVESSKYCWNCGGNGLILLMSLNKKICVDCDTVIPWFLDKDQTSLIQHQR
jgi:hypothetical protein